MGIRVCALACLAAVLAGCATPQVSMTKQVQADLERVESVLIIPQNNLDITVQPSNPGNTGLLGALIVIAIDSARQSSAEREAAPLLESLQGFDFRNVMMEASVDALNNINRVRLVLRPRVESVDSESAKRIAYDESSESAVLFCRVGYKYQSGNLLVTANAEIYPKKTALKQYRFKPEEANPLNDGNAIYRKSFHFIKQAVNPNTIRESLQEAAISVSKQLAADLNHGI